jgi:hypothetical protein
MSDTFLASLRRIAGVAKRNGDLYGTTLIVGYGMGAGRGQGFDVFEPEDLDAHLELIATLCKSNALLQTSHDELAAVNDKIHGANAGFMSKLLQEETELKTLRARVDELDKRVKADGCEALVKLMDDEISRQRERIAELEKRLEVDHVFTGEAMARAEVPPEERSGMIDGISARDSTIAMQSDIIDKQGEKIVMMAVEIAQLRYQIKHGIGSGGDGGAAGQPGEPGK